MAKKITAAKDAKAPTASDVAALLGKSHAQFQVLMGRPGTVREWRRYSKTAPWVVKVSEGDRTLFYVSPKPGHFEVTVVLGERQSPRRLPDVWAKSCTHPYARRRPTLRVGQFA